MTEVLITDITTGEIEGTGVFDKLMTSVKAHVQKEYDESRIKGSDYANVYLNALQATLAQAIEIVIKDKQLALQQSLQTAQIEDINAGIDLKSQQAEAVAIENSIKQEQSVQDLAIKYVQQVKIDKEAAMLGMDGVMKTSNQDVSSSSIYLPKYMKGN